LRRRTIAHCVAYRITHRVADRVAHGITHRIAHRIADCLTVTASSSRNLPLEDADQSYSGHIRL
jgi:hypothetical protein